MLRTFFGHSPSILLGMLLACSGHAPGNHRATTGQAPSILEGYFEDARARLDERKKNNDDNSLK
jgi:hypothetical protein